MARVVGIVVVRVAAGELVLVDNGRLHARGP
jgi:hypothetical protein